MYAFSSPNIGRMQNIKPERMSLLYESQCLQRHEMGWKRKQVALMHHRRNINIQQRNDKALYPITTSYFTEFKHLSAQLAFNSLFTPLIIINYSIVHKVQKIETKTQMKIKTQMSR